MNDNIKKAGNEIIKELEISFNPYTRVVITVDGVRIVEDLAFEPLRVSSDTTDTKQWLINSYNYELYPIETKQFLVNQNE